MPTIFSSTSNNTNSTDNSNKIVTSDTILIDNSLVKLPLPVEFTPTPNSSSKIAHPKVSHTNTTQNENDNDYKEQSDIELDILKEKSKEPPAQSEQFSIQSSSSSFISSQPPSKATIKSGPSKQTAAIRFGNNYITDYRIQSEPPKPRFATNNRNYETKMSRMGPSIINKTSTDFNVSQNNENPSAIYRNLSSKNSEICHKYIHDPLRGMIKITEIIEIDNSGIINDDDDNNCETIDQFNTTQEYSTINDFNNQKSSSFRNSWDTQNLNYNNTNKIYHSCLPVKGQTSNSYQVKSKLDCDYTAHKDYIEEPNKHRPPHINEYYSNYGNNNSNYSSHNTFIKKSDQLNSNREIVFEIVNTNDNQSHLKLNSLSKSQPQINDLTSINNKTRFKDLKLKEEILHVLGRSNNNISNDIDVYSTTFDSNYNNYNSNSNRHYYDIRQDNFNSNTYRRPDIDSCQTDDECTVRANKPKKIVIKITGRNRSVSGDFRKMNITQDKDTITRLNEEMVCISFLSLKFN
jgi:hypothetical protein